MKEFWVYTLLRLLLFAATLGVVIGIWLAITDEVPLLWAFIIALLISGISSFWVLAGPRKRFAERVDARAKKAAGAFEEMRAKEDRD